MPKPMEDYRVKDLNPGNVIDEPGNAVVYNTGDWKSQRPVWNEQKCIKCGICWNYCPDNAIMASVPMNALRSASRWWRR